MLFFIHLVVDPVNHKEDYISFRGPEIMSFTNDLKWHYSNDSCNCVEVIAAVNKIFNFLLVWDTFQLL